MLKVQSRAALDELAGRRKPAPAAVPKPDLSADAVAGLVRAGEQMVAAAQLLVDAAHAPVKPKKLEAIVQRDKAGKMEKVIINII